VKGSILILLPKSVEIETILEENSENINKAECNELIIKHLILNHLNVLMNEALILLLLKIINSISILFEGALNIM